MLHNFVYDDVTQALPDLLARLENADEINSRAGLTKEMSHVSITLLEPWRREILTHYRKPNLAAQVAETMWVLTGRDDIGWLEHYLPRCRDFSDDGLTWRAGYGKRLRKWEDHAHVKVTDQLAYVINTLKASPSSRQAVMSIWDPAIDTDPGKDIPCNNWLSFNSRLGRLDLTVAIRSNDVIWGWSGINQFEWSALQEIVAGILGLEVGVLNFVQTSFHLYDRHFAKAHKIVEHREHVGPVNTIGLESVRFDARRFGSTLQGFDELADKWFLIEKMIRHGDDASALVELFPEPMMQSWLRILQWWWIDDEFLAPLEGTTLEVAAKVSVQPKRHREDRKKERMAVLYGAGPDKVDPEAGMAVQKAYKHIGGVLLNSMSQAFIDSLCALHLEKHEAYGDSWMKRGELFSILPNVGRKVDRVGTGGETADETSADTAGDLFVYLAKYETFLVGEPSDPLEANDVMHRVADEVSNMAVPAQQDIADDLNTMYDRLLDQAEAKDARRVALVKEMQVKAYMLARMLWIREQAGEGVDEYRGADRD